MDDEIRAIDDQITELKKKLSEARRRRPAEPVKDYEFKTVDGAAQLSSFFGEKSDLLVVHNMGAGCPYCTLWADGLNSLVPHIENRTSFIVVSPDAPEAQAKFAAGRGWKFRMANDASVEFTRDMGFLLNDSDYWPGVSAFRRGEDGSITRTGSAFFGPGDDFCAVWPLFDLLADGHSGWEPKYRYGE